MDKQKEFIFSLRHVNKTYHTGELETSALHDINLDIAAKEFVVILGPSGSGKSTLLNILGGLDVPSSGKILFHHSPLPHTSEKELTQYRRLHIGFVFQFYNLIPNLTAVENVSLVTEIADNPLKPTAVLKLLGLGHRLHHFPSQLSGGEQQRVAIARAIVKQPEILLCDEPTGAIDHHNSQVVLEALSLVNKKLGSTVIVVTHNTVISKMADRIIHIADGRITKITKPSKKLSPRHLTW